MEDFERVSAYEMIMPFPTDPDNALLVNGLYGAYDVISSDEAAVLEAARTDASELDALSPQTRERLATRGHLVRFSPQEEQENARIISRMYWLIPYQSTLDLVILPTYNCNFRCEYCFERKRLERGGAWLSRVMTREMADAIFHQLKTYRDKGVKLRRCILYGGEPLLSVNREIVSYLCERCKELDLPLVCVSNGYELDRFIDLLSAYHFEFLQVTVDGVGSTHDERRYLAGGQGSYERIMDNIELALKNDITIHLRINVNRENLQSAMELPEEFRRRGFTDYPHFAHYFKATTACFEEDPANAISDEQLFEALFAAGECSETNVSCSRVYQDMATRVARALKKDSYPPLSPANCGAESSMLVVDPDGMLYTCWDVVAMEEYSVGFTDVKAGRFLLNFDYPKWRTRTADMMEDCVACPMLMNCGGGCAIESQNTYGDMTRGFCGSVREAYQRVAPLICQKNHEVQGQKELSLSLFDLFLTLSEAERQILLTTTDQKEAHALLKDRLTRSSRFFG
jgi:uncharacterized protein